MKRRSILTLVTCVVLGCGPAGEDQGSLPGVGGDAGGGGSEDGGGDPGGASHIAGACSCDADCPSDGAHPGVCVLGICMTQASGACSAAGSTAECGEGSRCWGLEGVEGGLCWPDCDSHDCDGSCDADGSCAPTQDTNCDLSCAELCSCDGNDDCAAGEACIQGACVQGAGDGPGEGPGVDCPGVPPRDCVGSAEYCGELVAFDPRSTSFYEDYPINGETEGNQYRSYIRRQHAMLIAHVTAMVECKSAGWEVGNGGALGLGDMSEADGAIPGTSLGPGNEGHPPGTHEMGRDIDLGYYQIGTPNNRLRPICEHTAGGQDQYHCVGEPALLDVWRHALFLGYLFDSPITRVVGVDGKAGTIMASAITELCATGWLTQTACNNTPYLLAYETTDGGAGWYRFHHHHSHVSTCAGPCQPAAEPKRGTMTCKEPGCGVEPIIKENPHLFGRGKFNLQPWK